MTQRAFVIVGDRAARIANDVDDFRYRAAMHDIAAGLQMPAHCHAGAETQFMLEAGSLEFMVGGASGVITAPDFVRVPPGVSYAYRNAGAATARLLVRTVHPQPAIKIIRTCIEYAA